MIVDKIFLEKLEDRREDKETYDPGYDTTNRWFALKGVQVKLADLIGLLEAYKDDPEDSEETFVYGEYEGLLNIARQWAERIGSDMRDVSMDEDLKRANE